MIRLASMSEEEPLVALTATSNQAALGIGLDHRWTPCSTTAAQKVI